MSTFGQQAEQYLLMPLFEIPQSCSSKFPTLAG